MAYFQGLGGVLPQVENWIRCYAPHADSRLSSGAAIDVMARAVGFRYYVPVIGAAPQWDGVKPLHHSIPNVILVGTELDCNPIIEGAEMLLRQVLPPVKVLKAWPGAGEPAPSRRSYLSSWTKPFFIPTVPYPGGVLDGPVLVGGSASQYAHDTPEPALSPNPMPLLLALRNIAWASDDVLIKIEPLALEATRGLLRDMARRVATDGDPGPRMRRLLSIGSLVERQDN